MKQLFVILFSLLSLTATADKFSYLYLEAVRQQDQDHATQAYELFRRALALRPDAAEAHHALVLFDAAMGRDSLALLHAERAAALAPHNTEYAERLAQLYYHRDSLAAATRVYERLAAAEPDRTDCLMALLTLYKQQRDYDGVLRTLDRYELQEGKAEEITLEKMQAHSAKGDADGALRELQSLIDAHPADLNLRVMLGNWQQNNGRTDEALATFRQVLREEPDNAKCQMALIDHYRAAGDTARADTLLYKALVNPRTDSDTRVSLIRDLIRTTGTGEADSLRILTLFDRVLLLPQRTSEVATLRAAYLTVRQAPADTVIAAWRRVLDITPEDTPARLHLIQAMWADTVDARVVEECQRAVEYVPDEPALRYYLALAQYVGGDPHTALATLRLAQGMLDDDDDKSIAADIHGLVADIAFSLKQYDTAADSYRRCLAVDPDRVMTLNNYAYCLSVQNRDLKEAERMSYRAVTAEANNAVYLDTYAWILYQQQRYDDAKTYIDLAIAALDTITTTEVDILEHAGDIYLKVAQPQQAKQYWQQAIELDSPNKDIIRKKIKRTKK